MAAAGTRGTRHRLRPAALDVVALAVLAYVPFFLSSPGRLASDTKQYLYLDPGRFLSRVPFLWDPHVAAGTVPHQQIGYLFPMGPFYWLLDVVGAPDWVAQRIWLGTISLAAALGARWLFRRLGLGPLGALVAAVVYVLTPYQLAFTARISVLLLPWAALPWIVGLTMRAARRGGWRDPALIALVVLAIGGVNASALVLVGVAPALWIALELTAGRARARAALSATGRIVVLCIGTSAWWIAGLYLQGSRGLPILQLTENVRTVASSSAPGDILRGLGNWFFYGFDQSGPSVVQSTDYLHDSVVVISSYLVAALALLAGSVLRWRHRAFCAACIVVGAVVGVGAWPYDDTTPWGWLWERFTSDTSAGLALRNSPRVVPVVVRGGAGRHGAAVAAVRPPVWRRVGAVVIVAIVALAFLPVWRDGFLTPGVERPEAIPSYWTDAIRALDHGSHATRILEIPGSAFATYRWGNAIEPITPGLTSRPYIAREVLPAGSPESVNLLDAFDRRLQNGSFEPASLAPIARLLGVGTVSVRSDLAYERSGSPRPRVVWDALTDPRPPGLGRPRDFGAARPNRASTVDALDLRSTADADPPPVALFPVEDANRIVRTAADRDPVVVAGDGDGIVDTAAAGLITGHERVLELASLTDAQLRHALGTGAALVLTDSNRRRNTSYFSSIRDTKSPTLREGESASSPDGYDARVDLFRDRSDSARTVVETRGAEVDSSNDGSVDRPEDRAARAVDGDLHTAWRVGGADPDHAWIELRPDRAVRADHIDLTQPQGLPRDRWVSQVEVRVNGGAPRTVDLGDVSFTAAGQRVDFPETDVRDVRVEITGVHRPPFDPRFANAIGFAEIRLDDVHVEEVVRLPTDVAHRVGTRARTHTLAVVLSRLRQETGADGRQDEEARLDRRVVLPDSRRFTATGTARVDPNAPDERIDAWLGTAPAGTVYRASSHLAGDAGARASRAFTDRPGDAWTSAYGPQDGQWVEVSSDQPLTTDHLDLVVHVDRDHSAPTSITVVADGRPVTTAAVTVPDADRAAATDHPTALHIAFPPPSARTFRLSIDHAVPAPGTTPAPVAVPPVSIGEIGIPGLPPAPAAAAPLGACTAVLRVDGRPVRMRLAGPGADARRGLALVPCDGPLDLDAGSHRIVSDPGVATGLDVDRVLLTSGAGGSPSVPGPVVPATPSSPVRVDTASPTDMTVHTRSDGTPFWLVLGQSHSDGWSARTGGRDLGAPQLVDGYANAWLIRPTKAGPVTVHLSWTPQRTIWVALGITLVATVLCIALLVVARRRRRAANLADLPWYATWARPGRVLAPTTTAIVTVASFVGAALVSRWTVAVVAAAVAISAALVPRTRALLGLAAAALLLAARVGHDQELAWYALALFAVAVVVGVVARDDARAPAPPSPPRESDAAATVEP
jgi:arabinofuranan 3-O-arabinosyltransferase